MAIRNPQITEARFLQDMLDDAYFPRPLVERGQQILVRLCEAIEARRPTSLDELYQLTHAATDELNALAVAFEEQGSELETVARESIGADFRHIARAYGFDADGEALIATRDW